MIDRQEPNFSFRLISADDASLLAHFFDSLSDATKRIFGFPFDREYAERWVNEGIHDPDVRRYMVFEHSTDLHEPPVMLGTVWLWKWTMNVVWLGIMITDAYQNKGYGSKLMEIAITDAKKSNKGGILLTTHKTNLRAQKLYHKHGFEIIGEDLRGEYLLLLNFGDNNLIH